MNLFDTPIITSIVDDDLYKFTQQQAFMALFPTAIGEYRFHNRGVQRFNGDFLDTLSFQLKECLPALKTTDEELAFLEKRCPFLKSWYLDALKNYRYNPKAISLGLDQENNLYWSSEGLCQKEMMWEVKTMAIISELYFKIIEPEWTMAGQEELARSKASQLSENGCIYIDFGTRRRRNYATQDIVVREMKSFKGFVGTSNVHLAMKNDMIPKGTQAHEFFMAMQVLEGIRNSNYYALNNWVKVYNGDLGIALPDTLGTQQFLNDFGLRFAKLYDGVRWDSGDEYWFTDLIVNHYKKLKIDPMTKSIVYSNALDCDRAIKIQKYCVDKIKASFGIGTFFTNDFGLSKALNMVIKLWSVNRIPVVKISDDVGKVMGDKDAIRVTRWICQKKALD